jgi:hypothetical protein
VLCLIQEKYKDGNLRYLPALVNSEGINSLKIIRKSA